MDATGKDGAIRHVMSGVNPQACQELEFSLADVEERKFWKDYMKALEECLGATGTKDSPWFVVPADDKENARLIVSQIVVDALYELKMSYPRTSVERRKELLSIRQRLAS
jgi:polyphosphate kinase 2 (PPK2 family)